MGYKKLPLAVSLVSGLVSVAAFAGGGGSEVGNGGGAMVCRNDDGSIRDAMALDLYEGLHQHRYPYSSENLSVDEWLARAIRKLEVFPKTQHDVSQALVEVRSQRQYYEGGVKIFRKLLPDTRPNVTSEESGCGPETFAVFGKDGVLRIYPPVFEAVKRSPLSEAAFWLHEAVYKVTRDNGEVDVADPAIELTAFLLSEASFDWRTKDLLERYTERDQIPGWLRGSRYQASQYEIVRQDGAAGRTDCKIRLNSQLHRTTPSSHLSEVPAVYKTAVWMSEKGAGTHQPHEWMVAQSPNGSEEKKSASTFESLIPVDLRDRVISVVVSLVTYGSFRVDLQQQIVCGNTVLSDRNWSVKSVPGNKVEKTYTYYVK